MNDTDNKLLMQILKTLNEFQLQTTVAINELRAEVKENKKEIQKSREIENAHWEENKRLWEENRKRWDENDRRWDENDKRWEENDRRWEENKKLWDENKKLWVQYKIDRKTDRDEILGVLTRFDFIISKKLGDPNADKMKNIIDITKIKR